MVEKYKETKEKVEFECFADDGDSARAQFRATYNDVVRPYRYKVRAYVAVPGLGRSFAWKDVETFLGPIRDLRRDSKR